MPGDSSGVRAEIKPFEPDLDYASVGRQVMRFTTVFLLSSIFLSSLIHASSLHVKSQVVDLQSGVVIPGVEIFNTTNGTITDLEGNFTLEANDTDTLTIRRMGYETLQMPADQIGRHTLLKAKVLEGQSISVTSNRVIPGITPVAYSRLDMKEIEVRYSVQDVPMILSSEAGVHAYSESGNGTGYSYVSIRGFDQSRISVMIDNVPLNDNESHQVYWVDHGDILSSAEDVEIQRGVGNSLYGATAFGGSININTGIRSEDEKLEVSTLVGSYNTSKYRFGYKSGKRFGENLSLSLRGSLLESDGYRIDSKSDQQSMAFGLEHHVEGLTNQFRAIIGKEFSILQWDGISQEYLDDPDLRRDKMSWTVPFTDDYLQQIYSLNTHYYFNDHSTLRNVAYLVKGDGYYEVEKYSQDYYSYNLDVNDIYPDSIEQALEVDFLRRKWINNIYYGITPVWTYEAQAWRSDLGLELRRYTGDHFGEVLNVSDDDLASVLPSTYEYYSYEGQKQLATAFGHFLYRFSPRLSSSIDVRAQGIWWQLNQETIGHASGVDLAADWQFLNSRFGLRYELTDELSVFGGLGTAQKEPADAQIIEPDDVWSTPNLAPAEGIRDLELGLNWFGGMNQFALNLYRIDYENELLTDIYDFQDGSYAVETAEITVHQGIEIEGKAQLYKHLNLNMNGSLSDHRFSGGTYEDMQLANVPGILGNAQLSYQPSANFQAAFMFKYVGKQYIDFENTEEIAIPAYLLSALALQAEAYKLKIQLNINNIFNTSYATYGYSYYGGYYWPGATRNYSLNLNYSF